MDRQTPRFEHDCSGCQYLGTTASGYDVYQCDHIDLILRFGDAEEDNKALPISIVARNRQDSPMWVAALELYEARYRRRAV